MSPIHVRWYIRRDLEEMIDIEYQCFPKPWSENDFFQTLQNRKVSAFVAEYREKIIGYLLFETLLMPICNYVFFLIKTTI